MGHSVLVVEGAEDVRALLVSVLQRAGMDTREATTGSECLAQVRESQPDLVVLDLGLPDADGTEVCRQLRAMSSCYVLMLSSSAEEVDLLVGLAVGADGYMVKPISPRELTARVQTMLRRVRSQPATPVPDGHHHRRRSTDDVRPRRRSTDAGPEVSNVERVGDLEVDLDAREVRIASTQVPVTRTEFDLLAMLASSPGRVFQRETLLHGVWQSEWEGDARLVEVHMSNLRRKLAAAGVVNPGIRTVRGVGYRLVP
ncbi:MAG TPA: response regulator transcription factor [Dermatophilaceae bacterium]|nr:response regulator transcription factor [Dermatophilaceae bacterium]